jgi:alpha-ketoglutarate-dependent taurine dioxygenase
MSIMELVKTEPVLLQPFGARMQADHPQSSPATLKAKALRNLVARHRLVVLRGFADLDKLGFVYFGRSFGELFEHEFGYLFELVVHENPKNYFFTSGRVPFHWDGAFFDQVPSLLLFRCLRAPAAAAGGETIFCDTTRVLANASESDREHWRRLELEYSTEKVAHYGGTVRRMLISRHPVTEDEVIRFGEPDGAVALNPLHADFFDDGRRLADAEKREFLRDFIPRLYAPDVMRSHVWQEGDYLIADNHALLHGRNAFPSAGPRHLFRVNVL